MRYITWITRIVICILFLHLTPSLIHAQEYIFNNRKHKLGFNVGYGAQNLNMAIANINPGDAEKISDFLENQGVDVDRIRMDVKYFYEVFYFQLQYYYTLARGRTSAMDLLLQPQYNITNYKQNDNVVDETKGYEFGLNIGFLARQNMLNNFFSLYLGVSTGPHYVSGTPERQSDGFIFSSSLFAGINIKLPCNVYLDVRPGFRHISNASMEHPNAGINNFFLNGGLFFTF